MSIELLISILIKRRLRLVSRRTLERMDFSIGHAESSFVMVHHGVPTPVLRVFQFLEDRPIKRLTDAEHEAMTGSNDWSLAAHVHLFGFIAFAHLFSLVGKVLSTLRPIGLFLAEDFQ